MQSLHDVITHCCFPRRCATYAGRRCRWTVHYGGVPARPIHKSKCISAAYEGSKPATPMKNGCVLHGHAQSTSLTPIALYSITEEFHCWTTGASSASYHVAGMSYLPLLLLDLLLLDPLGSSSCKAPPPSGQTMCRPLRLRCGLRSGFCFGLAPFSDPDMLPSITTAHGVLVILVFTCVQSQCSTHTML